MYILDNPLYFGCTQGMLFARWDVDGIGQLSDTIYCYSFLPADGVEQLIRLRERVRLRL